MLVSLIKDGKIHNLTLPNRIYGNYWITDYDDSNSVQNLINIEAQDGKWVLISNYQIGIMENNLDIPSVVLNEYQFYVLRDHGKNQYMLLYVAPVYDLTNKYFDCSRVSEITIGTDASCFLKYQFSLVSPIHAKLSYQNRRFIIYDNQSKWGVYVNNHKINGNKMLESGDIIFIMGLKIIVMIENDQPFLIINNPNHLVTYPLDVLGEKMINQISNQQPLNETEDLEAELYQEEDYFHKKPRFHSTIQTLDMQVDAPPARQKEDDKPVLLTIGPMLTMGMTSGVIAFTTINNIQSGKTTWGASLPSLVMAGAMLASMLLWPLLTKQYEKRKRKRDEKLRQEKYGAYIEEKRQLIIHTIQEQRHILIENHPSLKECQDIILQKKFNLWERKPEEEDFLTVSLGTGTLPMRISIHYPEDHFSMDEDNLKDLVSKLGNEPKNLVDVPVPLNFYEKYVAAFIGSAELNQKFMNRILLQLLAFHSYDDLKIVLFTNKDHEKDWEFLKMLPHNWSSDRSIRYFGTTSDEVKEICYHLDRYFSVRNEKSEQEWKKQIRIPYYLIITDDFKMIRSFDFVQNVLDQKVNTGFGFIILNDKVSNLPAECQVFLNVTMNTSELFENILNANIQKFQIDFETPVDLRLCAQILANIPIEMNENEEGKFPNKYSFLEMYDVGKIEQLNPVNRWKRSNPIQTLQAPVGVGKSGEKISLDLHEKFHGPHGLIAGMTGSGKSEFIITYILSMAVNYHPDEVQFILIDYKGGGLAGAFENKDTGVKLPHLVGTITNLDANEINRSLASIESELKRRQRMFNEAREISGESTIDIYKYQKLYRAGVVKEPISHLFIISDEFAELKSQEPEFMQQLISTARIGRSLGVHLILATQKPSGVVDNQIWSNTRFRVCLRVQEKSDSTEVIKCPDAAFLKQTGRFYLQVGYNEIFVLGQAAWCGATYYPAEKLKKNIDTSIDFIDNIGFVIKNIDNEKQKDLGPAMGEELTNIVKYLGTIAKEEQIVARPLWLDRIPNEIFVDCLTEKYQEPVVPFELNPIVGEYDVPNAQAQYLLTLPLSKKGNTIIYGTSGSGKENFLTTILYSSMKYHGPEEVNFYVMDFGSEALRMFQDAPHIGGIVFLNEEDRIHSLLKLLLKKIDERKKLFADFNGIYDYYIKNSGTGIPNIVVVINNYDAFSESYEEYFDWMSQLTREGSRYGIYFIVSLNNPNGMRLRLRQNFSQEYVLQQNNEADYSSILGNVHKKYPSKNFGRGIIKLNDIYEFQTAMVTLPEELNRFIKEQCQSWKEQYKTRAENIPMLPELVRFSDVKETAHSNNEFVIGMEKETLKIITYPFEKQFVNFIIAQDITILFPFSEVLMKQVLYFDRSSLIVINADEAELQMNFDQIRYYDNNFDQIFEQLEKAITTYYDAYQKNNYNRSVLSQVTPVTCIILGMDDFRNKLTVEHKNALSSLFEKGKDLGVFHFIFVDSIDKIKKLEVESWYRTVVNNTQGIWFGNGIAEQFSLKVSKVTKEMREEIPDHFCYVVKRGKAELVKAIQVFDESDFQTSKLQPGGGN